MFSALMNQQMMLLRMMLMILLPRMMLMMMILLPRMMLLILLHSLPRRRMNLRRRIQLRRMLALPDQLYPYRKLMSKHHNTCPNRLAFQHKLLCHMCNHLESWA